MSQSAQLRDLILNTRVPLILNNFPLEWECFNGTLHDWCERFDQECSDPPAFELMELTDCNTPQWERKRTRASNLRGMQQFLREYGVLDEEHTHWAAFQYKRAHELPLASRRGIDFSGFGFPEHDNDFSLWLGSEQANTPCHYDTFGVNIVVQVHGYKSWLLFPPETPLQSTRIPYEESSVYCLENFYAPAPEKMKHFEELGSQAYHCILQAGEVLIVPRHWWHYVEAMSTSLSVNYWVPLKEDIDLALDEFLVKHIVESFVKGESEQLKEYLLNPNQLEEVASTPSELFAQFQRAVHNAESGQNSRKLWETEYLSKADCSNLLQSMNLNIRPLQVMPADDYKHLLQSNAKRHERSSPTAVESSPVSFTWEQLVSSMCAPRVIAGMKREFFRRLQNNSS
ncbi:hypothetical protein KR009_004824 [Drosophila setifemur]|nr:hypothetical protein KR009_004824 [Drosophila setifemur]